MIHYIIQLSPIEQKHMKTCLIFYYNDYTHSRSELIFKENATCH